jgi:hypothetical protein
MPTGLGLTKNVFTSNAIALEEVICHKYFVCFALDFEWRDIPEFVLLQKLYTTSPLLHVAL